MKGKERNGHKILRLTRNKVKYIHEKFLNMGARKDMTVRNVLEEKDSDKSKGKKDAQNIYQIS